MVTSRANSWIKIFRNLGHDTLVTQVSHSYAPSDHSYTVHDRKPYSNKYIEIILNKIKFVFCRVALPKLFSVVNLLFLRKY